MGTMNLDMSSARAFKRNETVTQIEYIRARSEPTDSDENATSEPDNTATPSNNVTLSATAASRISQTLEVTSSSESTGETEDGDAFERVSAQFQKLLTLIEKMFHVKIDVYDHDEYGDRNDVDFEQATLSQSSQPIPDNIDTRNFEWVRQNYHHIVESEDTSFTAKGEVVLSNGMNINVDFSLNMSRTREEEYYGEVVFSGAMVDPLVVNLNGNAAQLTNNKVGFDLDNDGEEDQVHFASGDSAFLALDRNGNGKIDDGSELFGPQSGSGFADLAAYDENGDGMIDELDSVFEQLVLTQRDENGEETLISLKDVGIEAFLLERSDTPFSLFNDKGERTGVIRETGLYVKADGSVDSLQHVDLVV